MRRAVRPAVCAYGDVLVAASSSQNGRKAQKRRYPYSALTNFEVYTLQTISSVKQQRWRLMQQQQRQQQYACAPRRRAYDDTPNKGRAPNGRGGTQSGQEGAKAGGQRDGIEVTKT